MSMSGRLYVGAAAAVVMLTLLGRPAGAQDEPNLELPLPACIPTAAGFIGRTQAIRDWVKKAVGDPNNGQLVAKLRTVAARRSGAPGWTARTAAWSDSGEYTVHFAVGKVADYQNASAALNEAERRAKAAVDAVAGGGTPFILDWYTNADGVCYALAGAIAPVKPGAPAAPEPEPATTPTPAPPTSAVPPDAS